MRLLHFRNEVAFRGREKGCPWRNIAANIIWIRLADRMYEASHRTVMDSQIYKQEDNCQYNKSDTSCDNIVGFYRCCNGIYCEFSIILCIKEGIQLLPPNLPVIFHYPEVLVVNCYRYGK